MAGQNSRKKLVVIGGGMAGMACVEEVLKTDANKYEITVLGKEPRHNYNRVLLSHVLTGEKSADDITLHPKEWFAERGVRALTGCEAIAIRRAQKRVECAGQVFLDYDRLVVATGARPIMPDIPGMDKEGVFAFRTLDDCERIRGYVLDNGLGGRDAVVIGGGLLGLEAAWGLKTLGMRVTIVHLAERLMERQLDVPGARLVQEDIERLDVKVLLGARSKEVLGNGRAEALRLEDRTLDASVVVASIGIRPEVSLARSSGIYCNKGIVVSDTMQSFDPAIYALGECVEHRGACFGLVAPIFEQARVAADQLAGTGRMVFKSRPVSTRLKVPGIELYAAGDAFGCDSVEHVDTKERIYRKVYLDEGRVKGLVLYGSIEDGVRLFQDLLDNADVGHRRRSLLFPDAAHPEKPRGFSSLPDSAIICGCNGVTKGALVDAIKKKGLFTRADVMRETKASASCGGCAGSVERVLEEVLGTDFHGVTNSGICPCTTYTREDVLRNIREKGLKSVGAVMETLGWETVGCDVCRPALNYYVSMVWPGIAEDDPTSRLVNERAHGNIQKDGAFSVVPRVLGGAISADELERIADAARRYGSSTLKITGGQRIAILGVKKEDLPLVWEDIKMPSGFAYAKALRTVKTCVGAQHCRYGTQDSLGLGIAIEKKLSGLWMPAKVKLGVSGCPRNCAEALIKDLGLLCVSGAFEIYAGGCAGIELKKAKLVAQVATEEEAIEVSFAIIQMYREEAEYAERTFKWVRRRGVDAIKKAVFDDIDSRRSFVERLEEATSHAIDPWSSRIGKGKGATL